MKDKLCCLNVCLWELEYVASQGENRFPYLKNHIFHISKAMIWDRTQSLKIGMMNKLRKMILISKVS